MRRKESGVSCRFWPKVYSNFHITNKQIMVYVPGNKGSSEITSIIYKPGECMTILLKLWREFESSKTGEVTSSSQGPTVEVRIPAKLVTTSNHQVMLSTIIFISILIC
mgnify:FL=1